MKKILTFLFALSLAVPLWGIVAVTSVQDLRVNGQVEPQNVEGTPVFSWLVALTTESRGIPRP